VKLQGRVALVFGGSSGIGRGCADAMADEGASVMIADPNEAGGKEVVAAIEGRGGKAAFIATDISDEDAVRRAVEATVGEFGSLDTLVTSAGAPIQDWSRGIEVYLKGPYYACRHALP
jgi:NAD(P)-dependent dehydrogenase (short-subunit alcohol dehydrogenase family)